VRAVIKYWRWCVRVVLRRIEFLAGWRDRGSETLIWGEEAEAWWEAGQGKEGSWRQAL
jgi:hypothetical protein